MPLGIDEAVALILRDGDPARSISGLDSLEDFRLYDDADSTKRRIHVGEEPQSPDEIVTVFIEGGGAPIGGGDPHEVGRRPGFTVRSRSDRYERAQEIAFECYAILSYYQGTSNGVPFFRILAVSDPFPLMPRDGGDEGGRVVFTQSFNAVTKRYTLS